MLVVNVGVGVGVGAVAGEQCSWRVGLGDCKGEGGVKVSSFMVVESGENMRCDVK